MGKRKLIVQINKDECIGCGNCVERCSKRILVMSHVDGRDCAKVSLPILCSGCGKCAKACPSNAITFTERTNNGTIHKTKTINNKIDKTMKTKGLGFALLFLVAIAGFSAATMLLWNALLPNIFGITTINFWQALGLLALVRILFGGMGGNAMKHLHRHHHQNHPMRDKWLKMTPEEREKFIKEKRQHFGFGRPFDKYCFDKNEYEEADKRND
jgi:MinD superfamily P-loop ATPase containing an inserted ferredoxin domain